MLQNIDIRDCSESLYGYFSFSPIAALSVFKFLQILLSSFQAAANTANFPLQMQEQHHQAPHQSKDKANAAHSTGLWSTD